MTQPFSELAWEFHVFTRSIAYPNLSGAAGHVGLSQPQLSRIIGRLEGALGVALLDRSIRRKSAWTPVAQEVAETYLRSTRRLESEMQRVLGAVVPDRVVFGALEGLLPLASTFVHRLLKKTPVHVAELNVYDLNELERLFLKGEVDLILTSREPGKRKFRFEKTLGRQSLETIKRPGEFQVLSSYEYGMRSLKPSSTAGSRVVVSNSLAVRRDWMERYGGMGVLPGNVQKQGESEVLLVANELFPEELWKSLLK